MQTHILKTEARYWDAAKRGQKTFEVRKNDRAFQTGDILELAKWNNEKPYGYITEDGHSDYPGNALKLRFRITYLLQGGQFGIEPGYCVLGLGPEK